MHAVFSTTEDRFFLSHRAQIAEALAAQGVRVTVAAGDTGQAEAIRALGYDFRPIPLVRESLSPMTEARTIAALARAYTELRPDVVHHSTIKANMYGSIAARLTGVSAIVNTITGLGFALTERPADDLKQRALRRFARRAYGVALSSPRCVNIFQNHDQLEDFVRRGLVDRSRATVILGAGVDLERFAFAPLPEGPPLVVLPARMLWDKGIGEMVAAARRLRGKARFALVGGEDAHNRARIPVETLRAWQNEGVVEWWGHRSDMPRVFADATLVVLPSYAEGLPLAIAEAQAVGRPCITSDAPGCREAIAPGKSGLLVPVRDHEALAGAIDRLLSDRARLQAMSVEARRYAEQHLDKRLIVTQTLAVFRQLGVAC